MYTVARGIIGFGLPFAIVAGSCLIGELGYAKERPILTSLFNASFYLGSVTAAGIAFGTSSLTNEWGWRIPGLLQMAPSLLQVVFVLFLPESPRFLISKERYEEAREILVKYHAEGDEDSAFVVAEFAEIKATIALERETSKASWMDLVRTAGMRRRLLIGSLLGIMTQLSGNVVISYFLYVEQPTSSALPTITPGKSSPRNRGPLLTFLSQRRRAQDDRIHRPSFPE